MRCPRALAVLALAAPSEPLVADASFALAVDVDVAVAELLKTSPLRTDDQPDCLHYSV